MDINTLEHFISVAELLNFSKAASILHITQPALSRKIAQLESDIGCELFHRRKPNMHLTEAGVFVLEKARRIVDLHDEMIADVSGMRQVPGGRLRIGYLNLSQFPLLSRSMDALGKTFSHIEINLRQHTLPELRTLLDDGELDLIFDMCTADDMDKECTYHQVSEGKLYA
ncbi:MAG: LysR family transcriptional regulator, partial [Clostridia bacterium]|nr:LysR family transcriptional regulator [Clostridia bacterium]